MQVVGLALSRGAATDSAAWCVLAGGHSQGGVECWCVGALAAVCGDVRAKRLLTVSVSPVSGSCTLVQLYYSHNMKFPANLVYPVLEGHDSSM